ncbi:Tenascin-R [Holothuria leucospilota]|uniref:Tenascin-R n=1 Tax=Holothuria leucospilota TaxID=206669 RepID=A0A9Q1BEB1_HOLLE|nr:Tenascin-R [Holothuria leucospilota]
MGFPIQLRRISFFVCVFGYYVECSVAQTNSRGHSSVGSEDHDQGSSYFFYQSPDHPRDCREVRDQCQSPVSNGVYLIKPDGYPQPFEVYCDNEIESGGWTVIQRRIDGSLDFQRNWEDYQRGFGFPSSEVWVGNERLSFLTNQNVYELRVDMVLSNGTSFHVNYNSFRVSDEWSKFILTSMGNYTGDAGAVITFCPQNMLYGNCTCASTCEDPSGTLNCQKSCDQSEGCVCQEGFLLKENECVHPSECGCYSAEENRVIPNGETYVNAACTEKCTCNGDQLNCDATYQCSSDATCRVEGGVRQCYCNEGYEGDGETCTPTFTDCNDVRAAGHTQDGVYTILPSGWSKSPFDVFCNMTIDGGNWIVFQRRNRGATSFYRNWDSYQSGFGDIRDEFWLGNDKLHYLTQQGTYELRVDFVSSSNSAKYAKYNRFRVDSAANKYRVTDIGTYSGNGGDGMNNVEDENFSTHDQDYDELSYDCAEKHRSGWWHGGYYYSYSSSYCNLWRDGSYYRRCSESSLNGDYNGGNGQNINWNYSNYCHIKYTEMKIRRIS